MKINLFMQTKTTFLPGKSVLEVQEGQKISDVVERELSSYGCEAVRVELVEPEQTLRRTLKEMMGFVEAWQLHLVDAGKDRSAETVLNVLDRAREVYKYSEGVTVNGVVPAKTKGVAPEKKRGAGDLGM